MKQVVNQIRARDYAKQRETEISREHTEWDVEQKYIILPADLKSGMVININGAPCLVQTVNEVQTRADFF